MKRFKQLKEANEKKVVFSFGRFNPPTTGHEKLIKAADAVARAQGADLMIFPSQSEDPKKNPLSFTDKVKFMRKMFRAYSKSISGDKSVKTSFDAITKLYDMGYTNITMVVGGDRVAEFDKLLNKYNGVKGRHGFYEFENGVQIKSAGNRADPDSDEAKEMSADAMSASLLRKIAADGDFELFSKGVPDTLGDTDKRVLFNKIRTGLKLAAINEMFELLFDEMLLSESGEPISEKAPPDDKILKWTEDPKVKSSFKDKYGDKWAEVMYATAWKMYNSKMKEQNEAWNIDEELDEDWAPANINELFAEEFKDYTKKSFEMLRERVKLTEEGEITQAHLNAIEKYADKLFTKVGIDVNFTRHFLDRVNDARNKKQITNAELVRLFKQTYAQYGKKIAQLGPDAEAVLNDIRTDVNMPFVLKWDDKNKELDMVAKTVMRKKDFKTPDTKLVVNGDEHTWKSTGHYTEDGEEWTGDQHYDQESGQVMTGKTHTDASKPLYHYKDLSPEARKKVDATINEGVAQDPDIKDREGSQPKKYYAGDMSKSTKEKRAAHFNKKKSGPAPGDASAETKPSKHTQNYKKMFGELFSELDEEKIAGLVDKAEKSGMPYDILKKVYDRGMAAYKTGHRPGATAQQWAFARVNSFVTKSDGTWGKADADLAAKVRGEEVELEEGFSDVVTATKLVNKYKNTGKEEDALEAIKFGWKWISNPTVRAIVVGAVKGLAEKEGMDWKEVRNFIKKNTGVDVDDVHQQFKECVDVKSLKSIREAYINEVTSNDLPQIGDVDGDGIDDDPYQDIQVRFVPYAVKIKGFPEFFLWSTSISKVRSSIRLTLKRMDDIESIERVTDAEVRSIHRNRAYNPSELRAKDDNLKVRQDAYYRESLEYGTDELVKSYKKATPGELEEAPQWIKQLITQLPGQKDKYQKAAQALIKLQQDEDPKGRHGLEYWASEMMRWTSGSLDARTLAKFARKILATESIFYAVENNQPLHSIYRPHSEMYYELFDVARELNVVSDGLDKYLLESTDIGEFARYDGEYVPLDIPLVEEWIDEEVELNSPKRGGSKKFYVYVKNDKGNVVKVSFGDTSGLKAKIDDPEARASFVARHDCDNKNDKTTPGYWSCRLPMYAKELGLSGGGDFFW